MIVFSTNVAGTIRYTYAKNPKKQNKKLPVTSYLVPYTKLIQDKSKT